MTVWKFTLPRPGANGVSLVDMPAAARPLSAGIQDDDLVVWALVDPTWVAGLPPQPHRFFVINTGDHAAIPARARFLNTVTHQPSGIVWHVFDDGLGARA